MKFLFGKDSLKDSDYQHVLSMLPEDMVHEFCSYFVRDCRNGNDAVTHEELQQHLNKLDTKQIITKLVAFRRKEVADKKATAQHHMVDQLKEMKEQIKALKKKVTYLKSSVRGKENQSEDQSSSYINLMEKASLGQSFVVEDTTLSALAIDEVLEDKLGIPFRDDDELRYKVTADVRHQLYNLLKYCELSYPKLILSKKSRYSSKDLKSAVNDADALQQCIQNLMMFVYKHMPNVRQAVDKGK